MFRKASLLLTVLAALALFVGAQGRSQAQSQYVYSCAWAGNSQLMTWGYTDTVTPNTYYIMWNGGSFIGWAYITGDDGTTATLNCVGYIYTNGQFSGYGNLALTYVRSGGNTYVNASVAPYGGQAASVTSGGFLPVTSGVVYY